VDVGKLQITVDLNADDLASEITKAVEAQLEPVLAKIRAQINETARDLNKIDGKKFVEVAVDAKAAEREISKQGDASARAATENEANAKALRDLAKAELEFAAAQKSGDLAQRSLAMSKLTQAMRDYEKVTGQSAMAADREVKNLNEAAAATERRATVSKRTATAQVANNKAIQDALAKTAKVAEESAERRVKAEQKVRDEVGKTEKVLDEAARRAAERVAGGGGSAGGGGRGGGGGGSGGGGTGVYGGRNFVTRFAMNPIGANTIGLALAGIPAATLVVTELGAALEQVAQSGLALPGIFAGIGTSAGTLAVGVSGLKKVVTDMVTAISTDDPKAWQKATDEMKNMAPAAQDTAKAIAMLTTGPLTDLRKQVQTNMFAGTADEIKQLSGVLIPHLTAGMGSVATAWNRTFKAIGATAGSQGNLSLLDQIFGNTAQAQTRANAAIAPLTHGLAQLTATSTNFLPRLADGLTKVATRFDEFISKSVQNGNLDKWISDGLTGMTHLGNAAINFGKTLTNIFAAAGGGEGFLTWLEKLTQRWAQFTGSTKGQSQLSAFFKQASADLKLWEPVLGNVFKIIGQIIGGAQAWSHVMLPFLNSASSVLLHMPGLIQAVTVAFLAWRTIAGITSLLDHLGGVGRSLDAIPAKARTAGAAIAAMDDEAAAGGAGVGGAAARGGRGRMGRVGRTAGALGLGVGIDQLFQGVDPGNASGQGTGGWLQAIGGGAVTGASIGAMLGPEGAAFGAAAGAVLGPALKGILDAFKGPEGPKPLVPGALTGQDYQSALNQIVSPGGPGGAPWNQQLVDQTVYGASGSFDPRKSPYASMQRGDVNYQTVLTEMQKQGGAFSSIPGLTADNAPQFLDRIMKQAQTAGSALDSLGGAITDLPTGEVVLTDPTPDILERIKELGGAVHSLPSGLIAIDTSQLNTAQHETDVLHDKLAKLFPGLGLTTTDGTPATPPTYGNPATDLPPGLQGLFPGRATGGIIGHYDEGGDNDTSGGSPLRTLLGLGSNFIDDAAVAATKFGSAALAGGKGALGPVMEAAGKVIAPLGVAAPFVMDAIDPQARVTGRDATSMGLGPRAPGVAGMVGGAGSFNGMLPGYSPGVDNMLLPVHGGGNIAVGGGEGVVIPEAMKALGPKWLYNLNSKYRSGLPRTNYAGGGILGSFVPGGQFGPGPEPDMPFGPSGVMSPKSDTENLLENIRNLLGGTAYGPLTQMQFSNQLQQMYLQQIATGGALTGTLAPGTTPGHLGPFGTPVAPINKPEAMIRGAIQALGGNPDIVMGPSSVEYAQQQGQAATQAIRGAVGEPGGLAALGRPGDPSAYIGPLTQFAQTGVLTPEMRAMGLDENSPIVSALTGARGAKGYEQLPGYIQQSLGGQGFTGQLTPENQSILGALGTFRGDTMKNALKQQQLNQTLLPFGGIAGIPKLLQDNPSILGGGIPGLVPGGAPAFGVASSGAGNSSLAAALASRNVPPQLARLIQGFSQTEGNNPAGNPTLGFKDAQLGGASDIGSHVDALLKQMQDRSGVAGAFPVNGTDQEQATWIARVVGQHGAPGEPSFPEYVQRVISGMTGAAPAATPGLPVMPQLVPQPGTGLPITPPPVQAPPGAPALWPGGPAPAPVPAAPPTAPVVPLPAPPPVAGLPFLPPPGRFDRPTPGGPFALPQPPVPTAPAPMPPGGPTAPWNKWPAGALPATPAPAAPPAVPWPPTAPPGAVPPPGMPAAPAAIAGSGLNLATIPIAAQKYANDCIDASARIILSHSGANLDEDQLQKVIAAGGTIGSQAAGMNQVNPAGKYVPMEGSGGSQQAMFDAIKRSIDTGAGSTLNIAPGSSLGGRNFGEGHFVAVTGYNPDGTLNISDTAGGGRQYSVSAADAYQASQGRGIVAGTGYGPPPVPGMPSPLAGGAIPGMPGTAGYPGFGGQFGAGGVFGGGGGVVPVMVTNWPGAGGAGMFGGGGALGQIANIAAGAAGPVLGAAGNVASGVANAAIGAVPGAVQSVFESPAGIAAPPVRTVQALNEHEPIQAVLAGLGINVPDLSRAGATGLSGATFEQGGAGTGGGAFDAEGRLLSATTSLYQRTSADLNANLVAMKDQIVGATTDVGNKLNKTALEPLLSAGVSAGMGAIPSLTLASMGTQLGTAMAPPIANAVGKAGGSGSTASDISALPFNATAATFQGLNTLVAAEGGGVAGGMPGVDSVPILGMPGEWIMTTDEVSKMGGFTGMTKFTAGLAKYGVKHMAAGGAINPGTAGTNQTGTLGADYFGLSQIPIIGAIIDVLINILLAMMGIQISVRDTMLNLTDNFRQFRGDSFKAFDAQGRLLDDTSGLIDRSMTSSTEVTQQRVLILTQVLEGVITYLIDKVAIPLAEAVGQAAINAAASAGGGALNAIAPGAGSAAGAAASALGDASVQIAGQVGQDFWGAAIPAIGDAISTGLLQNAAGTGLNSIFAPAGTISSITGLDTGVPSTASLTGALAGLLLPIMGLGALGVAFGPGSGPGALFDDGGMANGAGMLPKATMSPERVLSPQQTASFERLVSVLESGKLGGGTNVTVHAPFTVTGNAEGGQAAANRLLELLT
jgi:hypothetical protein